MKNIATLSLAALALAAAGCAATNGASTVAAAAPASGIAYCAADKLVRASDSLTCNWAKTAKEACDNRASSTLRAASVAEGPSKGGMCSSGDKLVYVTMK